MPDAFLGHGDWPREPETEAERIERWKREQKRPGALPVVELFTDLAPKPRAEQTSLFGGSNDAHDDEK